LNLEKLAHIFIFLWLFCQMLQIGLSVTANQVWESTKHAKVLSKGIAVNFFIVPLIGFGLLLLFKPDPLLSVGFLIAICFSGAPMGPPFTGLAKGSLPFAIGLMVILAALTPLISSAVLSSLMSFLPERVGIGIEYLKIIRTILVGQFLPLAAGLTLKGLASSFASKALAPVRMTTNILMLAACVLVIVTEYKSLGLFGVNAAIGITTLFVSSAFAGWWLGGPGTGLRKAVTLNTTIRNVPVAMVIVSGNFAGTPAVAATFVYSLVSTLGTMLLALLLRKISPEPSSKPEVPAAG